MINARMHNMYFVSILCPSGIEEKVLAFKKWMKEQFGCIVALKSPAHITLVTPFWFEEEKQAALAETFQAFKSDIGEVEIQLDGFSHFSNRVLFVNVKLNPPLEELRNQAENYFIQSWGDVIRKDDRPFHPHVTIANRDLKPGDFDSSWEHFSRKEFHETFSTKTIFLLKLMAGKWNVIAEKNW